MSDEVKRGLSDEELKEIEQRETSIASFVARQRLEYRAERWWSEDAPGIVANEDALALLAEVKRLRQLIQAHDTNGAPECYAIDPPPIKRES